MSLLRYLPFLNNPHSNIIIPWAGPLLYVCHILFDLISLVHMLFAYYALILMSCLSVFVSLSAANVPFIQPYFVKVPLNE